MILVDSSIWIDHLRHGDDRLKILLGTGQVMTHPFVIGELALGNMRQRKMLLDLLRNLPQAVAADDKEVFDFIERYSLAGLGIGYIDVHLLASARLTAVHLWTRDRRLKETAFKLNLADKAEQ